MAFGSTSERSIGSNAYPSWPASIFSISKMSFTKAKRRNLFVSALLVRSIVFSGTSPTAPSTIRPSDARIQVNGVQVTEHGKLAGKIALPDRGINNPPIDYEYVEFH